jgi:hypothetical protein
MLFQKQLFCQQNLRLSGSLCLQRLRAPFLGRFVKQGFSDFSVLLWPADRFASPLWVGLGLDLAWFRCFGFSESIALRMRVDAAQNHPRRRTGSHHAARATSTGYRAPRSESQAAGGPRSSFAGTNSNFTNYKMGPQFWRVYEICTLHKNGSHPERRKEIYRAGEIGGECAYLDLRDQLTRRRNAAACR